MDEVTSRDTIPACFVVKKEGTAFMFDGERILHYNQKQMKEKIVKKSLNDGGIVMELQKITLMDAYLIETLRNKGISNQEILTKIEQGNVEEWKDLHKHFDFNELLTFADQDRKVLESVLEDGYQVKYVTFQGMQNLIKYRFGKVKDKDYQLTETGITNLQLNEDQVNTLKQMLSANWIFNQDGEFVSLFHR
ncbi:hypothetical protein [Bacillus nitroreducens]